MSNNNYPPGTGDNDLNAPWNEEELPSWSPNGKTGNCDHCGEHGIEGETHALGDGFLQWENLCENCYIGLMDKYWQEILEPDRGY